MATSKELLTNLADELRTLTNTTDKMGLSVMAEHVSDANAEVNAQATKLAELKTILEGKAAGGGSGGNVETCTVTIGVDSGMNGPVYCTVLSETGANFNTFTHKYNEVSTIENVICNSILILKFSSAYSMTISGDGELLGLLFDSSYNMVAGILCKSGNITISFAMAHD